MRRRFIDSISQGNHRKHNSFEFLARYHIVGALKQTTCFLVLKCNINEMIEDGALMISAAVTAEDCSTR
jgi:hypothetical protein